MKKTTATIIALLLVFSIAACGGNGNNGGNGKLNSGNGNSSGSSGMNSGGNKAEAQPPNDIPETPASDFSYQYNAEISGIEITEYTGTAIKVRIPQMIEDVPVKIIGDEAFYENGIMEVYIPNGVVQIGSRAFMNCTGLSNINIPDGVVEIGSGAFMNCTGLSNINIPDGVVQIGDQAFYNCTGLSNINIPDSVVEIGTGAFYGCQGLTSVVIPDSVTIMGTRRSRTMGMFEACRSLTSVTIGNGVTYIGESAFADADALINVTIGNGVVEIGGWAFSGCTALTSIIIPDNVVEIGKGAFEDCTALTSIIIPDSVVKIDSGAFNGCTALTSVTIPDSVVGGIGGGAFNGCTALTSIVFNGDIRAGFLIQIDGYWWRVLDVRDGKALVISEDVLEYRAYHEYGGEITWAECSLRSYLNNEFYNTLSADTQARIAETQVTNNDNPERGTPGGANTTDKIFLLSIEEAKTYFSDDTARMAYGLDGEGAWWWLRSPGGYSYCAAFVSFGTMYGDGVVNIGGDGVGNDYSGVRPALWLNL
jgi:hypothetical protein